MQRKSKSKRNECIEAAHYQYAVGIVLIDLVGRWEYKANTTERIQLCRSPCRKPWFIRGRS